jgi:endonuclease/exonuclease/phosphatase family metal-dependent hydrolase
MNTVTIVSLNANDPSLFTWHVRRKRIHALHRELTGMAPDIICLQEIIFPDTAKLIRSELQACGYTVYPEKTSGFFAPGGLMTASKLPVRSSSFIPFKQQGSFFALDIFERSMVKGYHRIQLSLPGRTVLTVLNTHLHTPFGAYQSKDLPPLTAAQYNEILDREQPGRQYILAGDLNIIPHNTLYRHMMKTYHDPLSRSKSVTVTPLNSHRRFMHKLHGRIDYVLVTPDLAPRVRAHVIFDRMIRLPGGSRHHLSDHFGVWTQITC